LQKGRPEISTEMKLIASSKGTILSDANLAIPFLSPIAFL
jgi:hypothetical protein